MTPYPVEHHPVERLRMWTLALDCTCGWQGQRLYLGLLPGARNVEPVFHRAANLWANHVMEAEQLA